MIKYNHTKKFKNTTKKAAFLPVNKKIIAKTEPSNDKVEELKISNKQDPNQHIYREFFLGHKYINYFLYSTFLKK